MNLVPTLIDGATVVVLRVEYKIKDSDCEFFERLIVQFHNWIRETKIEYLVFDFEEEKFIPHEFILELMRLRKRFGGPFLFSGVNNQQKLTIESYGYNREYPFFMTPEDAIRALRIQCPGITETIIKSKINYNKGILGENEDHSPLKDIKKVVEKQRASC